MMQLVLLKPSIPPALLILRESVFCMGKNPIFKKTILVSVVAHNKLAEHDWDI
ncbi:MAG: hypothetical protein ACJAUD_002501 [Crocinitomicaceae bacterium]|jgi:hypothetical protein